MEHIYTDLAILGGGVAGMHAYKAALKSGVQPIIIEMGPIGKTSLHCGYIPTQILRKLSLQKTKTKGKNSNMPFLISANDATIHNHNPLQIIKQQSQKFIDNYIKDLYKIPEHNRIIGRAFFTDPHTLEIENTNIKITAKAIIIAVGSVPHIPYFLKNISDRVITSKQLFEIEQLPKRIAILGTGSIGLEVGQSLSRLGVETIFFGEDSLWHFTDEKIKKSAIASFKKNESAVMNSCITGVNKTENGIKIYYIDESKYEYFVEVDYILCATGRRPNFKNINIESTGIKFNNIGLPDINMFTMQTNIPHIFMAGDVSSANVNQQNAIHQGTVAGVNAALFPETPKRVNYKKIDTILTTPQMAIVGQSYEELKEKAKTKGLRFVIGEGLFKNNYYAQIMDESDGIIHLYFNVADRKFLGAELCGPDISHMAQLLNCSLTNNETIDKLINYRFYYPSTLELITDACKDAYNKLNLLQIDKDGNIDAILLDNEDDDLNLDFLQDDDDKNLDESKPYIREEDFDL